MESIGVINPGRRKPGAAGNVLVSDGHTAPVAKRGQRWSQADVERICDAAERAWKVAGRSAKGVKFTLNGQTFVTRLRGLRLTVDLENGQKVCCRWQ
jgi:hypothetical protein